eukprot:gene11898-14051_t
MQEAGDAGLWKLTQAASWFSDFPEDRWGRLAASGIAELENMGARMSGNFQKLFSSGNGSISVQATKKQRCQQSAEAFIRGLQADASRIKTDFDTCPLGTTPSWKHSQLRFFEDCEKYQRFKDGDAWQAELKNFENSFVNETCLSKVMQRIFGEIPTEEGKSRDLWLNFQNRSLEIVRVVYALCQTQASVSRTASEWCSVFNADDRDTITRLEYGEDLEMYYEKGVIEQPSHMACPLASDFLKTMSVAKDETIAEGGAIEFSRSIASLRFAHAETLMPFVHILEPLNGSLFTPLTAENYDASGQRLWRGQRLFPMACNVQMILYKCEAAPLYRVRTLLNEGEVSLNACHGEVYCDLGVVQSLLKNISCSEDAFVQKCGSRVAC